MWTSAARIKSSTCSRPSRCGTTRCGIAPACCGNPGMASRGNSVAPTDLVARRPAATAARWPQALRRAFDQGDVFQRRRSGPPRARTAPPCDRARCDARGIARQRTNSVPRRAQRLLRCVGIRLTQAASGRHWLFVPGKQARASARFMRVPGAKPQAEGRLVAVPAAYHTPDSPAQKGGHPRGKRVAGGLVICLGEWRVGGRSDAVCSRRG